jgi:hypothetical protein
MTDEMTPILKRLYEQLLKEMHVFQSHLTDQDSPCEAESDMCVRKHLLIIEASAKEAIPLETDQKFQRKLGQLAVEARLKRNSEAEQHDGDDHGFAEDDSEWVAAWRKQIVADQGLAGNHSKWIRSWRTVFESRALSET